MGNFPECEQFANNPTRYRWCRNEFGDTARSNRWRHGQGLRPIGDNATAPVSDRKENSSAKKIPKKSESKPPLVLVGPGTELAAVLDILGIKMPDGCDCKKTMLKMNEYGVQGCREKFDEIVQKIKDNQERWGWKDKLGNWRAAGWNYMKHRELWRWVNPLNPIPGLVRFAIHLTETKGTAK